MLRVAKQIWLLRHAVMASVTREPRMSTIDTELICGLNDHFRLTLTGDTLMVNRGFNVLPGTIKARALIRLRDFDNFTKDNDPSGEHAAGSFEEAEYQFFWKIDCYDDKDRECEAQDPSNPEVTRVLTLSVWELGSPRRPVGAATLE